MDNEKKYVSANQWTLASVQSIPSIVSYEIPVNETGNPLLNLETNDITQDSTMLPSTLTFPINRQIENPSNITNSSLNRFLNVNFLNQSNDQINPDEANLIIDSITRLKMENTNLESKAHYLENEIENLTKENENLKKNLDQKSKELKTTIVAKDSEIQNQEISNADLMNANTRLQNTIDLLKSRLLDCESRSKRNTDSLQNCYREEKEELEKQIHHYDLENSRLWECNKTLEKNKGVLSKELKDLNEKNLRLEEDITNLNHDIEYLKIKLNSSEKKITNLVMENREQQRELDEKTDWTKSLNLKKNQSKIKEMEINIEELEDQLKTEISKGDKMKSNLQKEINSLREKLKESKETNKIIFEDNRNLKTELKLLEKAKKITEKSFDSYKNETKIAIQTLIDDAEGKVQHEYPQWWEDHTNKN